jgi:NitT/TauT family transport system substrate-binding protein
MTVQIVRPPVRVVRRTLLAAAGAALAAPAIIRRARAATTIRIAEQFGVGYLPLHMIRDRDLLAKHGRDAGVEIAVEWVKLSGGAAMNEALLSGGIDVATGGVTPMLTLWDRTRGNLGIKGIGALVTMPYHLLVNRPDLTSLDDLGPNDKIAVPSVGVSIQSRTLQMAAAPRWGQSEWARLEPLTVTLPHPEAVAALASPGSGITGHFSSPPFQYQQLAKPGIKRLLSSYDVLGGPATAILLWCTARFREEQPQVYGAFGLALEEAVALIQADKAAAAETYIRVESSKIDLALLRQILDDPEITFTTTPRQTDQHAGFMSRIGAIKAEPASWRDYFFPEAHALEGS